MPADTPDFAPSIPSTRARLTNHKELLPDLDGRSAGAKRFRDLVKAFISDMGGLANCSEVQVGLARRLAATSVMAEALEAKAVSGELIDVSEYCNLASTSVRLSSRLGVARIPRDVTPSVADYVRHINEALPEDAA